MSNDLIKHEGHVPSKSNEIELSIIEQVVMQGDLSKLNPEQRVTYYRKVCESAGLNPYTRPFDYILLNGKLTLYAKKDCTEQLRKLNGISIESLEDKMVDDIYIVTAKATDKNGRVDQAKGAVTIGNLKGDAKANAIMKAETKAKRRVTLSICGMGLTDESEVDSIPNVKHVEVDTDTGEILPAPTEYCLSIEIDELKKLISACDPDKQESFSKFLESKMPSGQLERKSYIALRNRLIVNRNEYQDKLINSITVQKDEVKDEE